MHFRGTRAEERVAFRDLERRETEFVRVSERAAKLILAAPADGTFVMGNGSARRTDASPGPYDARAVPFDDALGRALHAGDRAALAEVDADLARELWATVEPIRRVAALTELSGAKVEYDAAPFGVQYWVMRWS